MELFSKQLSQTDAEIRFSFPLKFLNEFEFPEGKDMVEFEVIDSIGKPWKFGLTRRKLPRHHHPKPVLSSGWLPYVREKGLKKNDRVIFLVQKDKGTKRKFKIQAQRKSHSPFKLFGKEIVEHWVDVEKLGLEPEVKAA